jgi:hypothetical protein
VRFGVRFCGNAFNARMIAVTMPGSASEQTHTLAPSRSKPIRGAASTKAALPPTRISAPQSLPGRTLGFDLLRQPPGRELRVAI